METIFGSEGLQLLIFFAWIAVVFFIAWRCKGMGKRRELPQAPMFINSRISKSKKTISRRANDVNANLCR